MANHGIRAMCKALYLWLVLSLASRFVSQNLFCGATAESSNVKVLNDDNFDKFVADHPFVLVKFYADWCVHCKNMAPEYENAAKLLKEEKSDVVLAKVRNEEGQKLMEKYAVRGFPTLLFFRKGAHLEYNGSREVSAAQTQAAGLVTWVKEMKLSAVTFLKDAAELPKDKVFLLAYTKYTADELEDRKTSAMFERFSNEAVKHRGHVKAFNLSTAHKDLSEANKWRASKEWEHFKEVAKKNVDWAKAVETVLRREEELKGKEREEEYLAFHPGEGFTRFEGSTEHELADFMEQETVPLFPEINQDNYMRFITSGKDMAWFCATEADYDRHKDVFTKVARALRHEVLFVWVNSEKFTTINEVFLVTHLPALAHQMANGRFLLQPNAPTEAKKYDFDTFEHLLEFYHDVKAGLVPKSVRSEEEPKDNSGPVKVVVGSTLEKLFTQNKNVLLMIHAPHCQHCKNFLPVYTEFATTNKDNDSLIVASFNGDANESTLDEVNWDSFPTLLYFKAGERMPVKFAGERTAEGLREFVVQNGGQVGDVYTEL